MRGKNAKESALQVPWNARITKYVGLISFGISVCKKPGGGYLPVSNSGKSSARFLAAPAGFALTQRRRGRTMPKIGATPAARRTSHRLETVPGRGRLWLPKKS